MTPLVSRMSAVLLLLLACAATWFVLADPVLRRAAEERASLELKLATIQRLKALIAAEPDFARRLAEREASEASRTMFLPGNSEAGAIAFLQERVKRMIEENGASLVSMEALAPRAAGELRRVGLRVELGANIGALQRILHGLEAGEPAILVEAFAVRARANEFRVGRDPLDITLEIAGFRAGGGAS